MKDFDAAIEQRIKTFMGELHVLVRQAAVEAVEDALGIKRTDVARPRRQKAPKAEAIAPKKSAAPQLAGRRAPGELARTVTKVREHVLTNPGQSVEQIGKALGLPTKYLALPLKKLLKSGDVRKTGIKRNTKYFPARTEPGTKVAKKRNAKK
jgi:hypothetical protein